jgi:hypothetical protein
MDWTEKEKELGDIVNKPNEKYKGLHKIMIIKSEHVHPELVYNSFCINGFFWVLNWILDDI